MARKTRKRNPTGPKLSTDDLIKTRRGKRIHFRDPNTGAALCGAGLPNKEFPFGSVVEIASPSGRATLTCYRCIKLIALNRAQGRQPTPAARGQLTLAGERKRRNAPPKKKKTARKNPVAVRTFSPTGKEKGSHYVGDKKRKGRRDQHVMVPGGRQGRYGADTRRGPRYDDWLEDSPWEPGPPEARTQPRYWGDRRPTRRQREFERKMMTDREYQSSDWNSFQRHGKRPGLRTKTKRRADAYREAREAEPRVENYYREEKRQMDLYSNPRSEQGFDVRAKFAELQAMPDSAFVPNKTKKKRRR